MPQITRAAELRRQNRELRAKMDEILTDAAAEDRDLTAEDRTAFDAMDAEFETRAADIERAERHEARTAAEQALDPRQAGRGHQGTGGAAGEGDPEDRQAAAEKLQRQRRQAFARYLRTPVTDLSAEDRQVLQGMHQQLSNPDGSAVHVVNADSEVRALGLTGSAGGFTVPQEFMADLDKAEQLVSGVLQSNAHRFQTSTGATMPWPTVNDTSNSGELLAEGSSATDSDDPTYGAINFNAYVYTSKIVRVANQLVQDTAFDLEGHLSELFGERFGRILNTHFTVGDGSAKPNGFVTSALAASATVAAASATAISYLDFVDLEHGLDPAYRPQNAEMMMHDDILKATKKLLDGDSRPLFVSGMAVGAPNTIMGYPYVINQDMDATMASGKESVAFGVFRKYKVREVLNPVMMVLRERYAELFQTGFVMFGRWDGDLVDAGTKPIQLLQH